MIASDHWELRLLDDFKLIAGGEPCLSIPRKGVALLGFLALQRQRSSRRDAIARLLWENADRAQARVSLRQLLSTLRKLQDGAPALVEADADSIWLSREVCIDAEDFELLARAGRTSDQRACELYRTDLLASIYLPDAPAFHEWLAVEQTRLRNHLVAILVDGLERGLSEGGDLNEALSAALRLLRLDPYNEIGHRGLMRAYSRQGRSALAIHQYRSLCALLRRELQVAPETTTTQLYEALMMQRRNAMPLKNASTGPRIDAGETAHGGSCARGWSNRYDAHWPRPDMLQRSSVTFRLARNAVSI